MARLVAEKKALAAAEGAVTTAEGAVTAAEASSGVDALPTAQQALADAEANAQDEAYALAATTAAAKQQSWQSWQLGSKQDMQR